jgi:hypothetical protein
MKCKKWIITHREEANKKQVSQWTAGYDKDLCELQMNKPERHKG